MIVDVSPILRHVSGTDFFCWVWSSKMNLLMGHWYRYTLQMQCKTQDSRHRQDDITILYVIIFQFQDPELNLHLPQDAPTFIYVQRVRSMPLPARRSWQRIAIWCFYLVQSRAMKNHQSRKSERNSRKQFNPTSQLCMVKLLAWKPCHANLWAKSFSALEFWCVYFGIYFQFNMSTLIWMNFDTSSSNFTIRKRKNRTTSYPRFLNIFFLPEMLILDVESFATMRWASKSHGVFVHAAKSEPFGLCLLEAAASGLPVVASLNGGPGQIIQSYLVLGGMCINFVVHVFFFASQHVFFIRNGLPGSSLSKVRLFFRRSHVQEVSNDVSFRRPSATEVAIMASQWTPCQTRLWGRHWGRYGTYVNEA